MSLPIEINLPDESATVAMGQTLSGALRVALQPTDAEPAGALVVYLQGELGAGKTTLCRGIVRAFGHKGAVKSPTFTLVEPYQLPVCAIYHFDLYRLGEPEEFEYIGVDTYFSEPGALCLVEWPDRAGAGLPAPDIELRLSETAAGEFGRNASAADQAQQGLSRLLRAQAHSTRGSRVLAAMERTG